MRGLILFYNRLFSRVSGREFNKQSQSRRVFRGQPLLLMMLALGAGMLFIIGCESPKDPFSAANTAPGISEFAFTSDSLKFTGVPPNDVVYLNLNYNDSEGQELTAIFKFLNGKGRIIHTQFTNETITENAVTFNVPSSFNSNQAGRVAFIPEINGLTEIELVLGDKVKSSSQTAQTFLFTNLTPLASFTTTLESNVAPYQVEVDASESRDRDNGNIEFYYWDFGDGSDVLKTQSETFQHSYLQAGRYTIRLKVEDNDGGKDSTEQAISTDNQPPLAVLQVSPLSGAAPHNIQFAATNSIDPDGEIASYRIDFGDGSSTLNNTGSHTYTFDSNFRVKLTVTDNLGQQDTTGITVQVATPPIAALSISPETGPFPLQTQIDASDSRDPQNGEVDVDIFIGNQLVYDNVSNILHTFMDPGTFQVRIVVTNQRNGLSAETTRSVVVENLDPVANFDWTPDSAIHQTRVVYESTSFDPNSTDFISFYRWTFPGGIVKQGADSSNVAVLYDAGFNPYQVRLEVWDKFRGGEFEGYNSVTIVIPRK